MAVFVGGCTLEAVAAVCGPQPASDESDEQILQALATLLDKSLIRNDGPRQRPSGQQGRIYMLETIREYALEQLTSGGEAEDLRRAHALYYLALAEEAETNMIGPDQASWFGRLEHEHDNLRAALAWASANGDAQTGARIASALWRFWLTRGHMSEGRRWLDTFLAAGSALPTEIRARSLNGAGRLAVRQGDFVSARSLLEESLALWRSLGGKRGEMEVLDNLGLAAIYQDDFDLAQRFFEQSLAGWRALGNKQGLTTALNRLGLAMRYQHKYEDAARLYQECLALARELNDTYYISAALHNLGQMVHHQGDDARAHSLLVESIQLVRKLGDTPSISVLLADIAGVWAAQGDPVRAARLFGVAEALRDKMQVSMYAAQREAYHRDLERARAQLDEATWQAAWAEGRSMTLDQALSMALEDLPPSPLTSPSPPQNPYDLTERELEVLRLLVAGLTYAQMAEQLMVSFHTVHAHLRAIYAKLGVTSRAQATRFATEHGLV